MKPNPFPLLRNNVIYCVAIYNFLNKIDRSVVFFEQFVNDCAQSKSSQTYVTPQSTESRNGGASNYVEQIFMMNLREQITSAPLNNCNQIFILIFFILCYN